MPSAFLDSFIELPTIYLPRIAESQIPLPMWDTAFLVSNSSHKRAIRSLLRPLDDTSELHPWMNVADTGFIAIEIDDLLFLGTDEAGFDIVSEYFEPLANEITF